MFGAQPPSQSPNPLFRSFPFASTPSPLFTSTNPAQSPPTSSPNLYASTPGLFPFRPTASLNPEPNYDKELKELEEMGFTDRVANLAALRSTNGSVVDAIQILFPDPN